MGVCIVGAHHWQRIRRFPQEKQVVRARRMLLAALSFVAWQGVFAESPLKPEGVATNSWPSEIALIQPVEFPTAAGSGQTGTVKVPQGAVM